MKDLFIRPSSPLQTQSNSPLSWQAILSQWIADLDYFSEMMDYEDAIHERLERANAGVLSIAAAKCGYIVLPEADIVRSDTGKTGWLDILLLDPTQDMSTLVECKWNQVVERMLTYPVLKRKAENELRKAETDIKKIITSSLLAENVLRYRNVQGVGVAFICPTFDDQKWPTIQTWLNSAIAEYKKDIFYDAMAWYFSDRLIKVRRYRHVCPGVFVFCKATTVA